MATVIDDKELDLANAQADEETVGEPYVHEFAKPFTYEGKTYDKLVFDWYALTGKDSLAIETEMAMLGKTVIVPEFSGDYLMRMAAKACTTKIGSDVIEALPLVDFNKIRNRARSFLLKSGQ